MKPAWLRTALVLLLWGGSAAWAQPAVFRVEAAQSRVEFTLGATMHTVRGTFRMKDSSVEFDPQTGSASGAFVVDATSAATANQGRDKKMHKQVLESAKYPQIRFTVQQFHGTLPANGTAQVQLAGVLNLHGADHPFTTTAPVQVSNGRASADVHFEVPYVDWGMKDPSTLFLRVSKTVEIEVHAVGTIVAQKAAAR